MKRATALVATTLVVLTRLAAADVIYVDDDASPDGDGHTWSTARRFLFSAISQSRPGDEIRVAGGTYLTEFASFRLKSGVAIRGGYRGLAGGGDPDDRDLSQFRSLLISDQPHVVRAAGVDASAILDGFEIREAIAEINHFPFEEDDDCGAAIYAVGGSPTIRSCVFADNGATDDGGAIYGGSGILDGCVFLRNDASDLGGAIYDRNEGWDIRNCSFRSNRAALGGAVTSNSDITNCLFDRNRADHGAAIYGGRSVVNCTIVNHAESAATFCVILVETIRNCILWGNTLVPKDDVSFSCIENWTHGGPGNIATNPQFRDADGPDDIPGTADDDYRLATGSACIDAADSGAVPNWSEEDILGKPRLADDKLAEDTGLGKPIVVDMGAMEVNRCIGEVTGDFVVDLQDLAVLLGSFGLGGQPAYAAGNLNEDAVVDAQDLQLLLSNYGRCLD